MTLLTAEGHHARGCYNGADAYDCVDAFDADVVLPDIGLPGINGWDVARRIRARWPGRRPMIIGITGEFSKSAERAFAESAGFDVYLIKPADPAVLMRILQKAKAELIAAPP
jgi:DNA-binding response OmpR family regulator